MRRNRVAPPIDLMAELEGDDDDPKKQSTLTQQPTLVGPQTAPKPTLTAQKTIVQPTTAASRPNSARTAPFWAPVVGDRNKDSYSYPVKKTII